MMKKYIFGLMFLLVPATFTFAQNIELPDLTTVVSGETVKAGIDTLPNFTDVMLEKEGSGNVVPVLPDVDTPADSTMNVINSVQAEKTIFAEGMIGGGYPSLFTGDFSVFRLSGESPFKIAFSHDSAVGYGNHSLGDGYNDRSTNLTVEKVFQKNQFTFKAAGSYKALSNGLQRHVPGLTSLNQDLYSGSGMVQWNVNSIFTTGVKADVNFYNRYADVAEGEFTAASVLNLNPELFANIEINDFTVRISGNYWLDNDVNNKVSEEIAHRGLFDAGLSWESDYIRAFGTVGLVIGNRLNGNDVVVPFTLGIDSAFPVYFSNRRFSIGAEGGLITVNNKVSDLESKYKFTGLTDMPSENSDWYGKLNISVPLKESFTGNAVFEYKKTAFNNGLLQPLYKSINTGIYGYEIRDMQQFISDLSLAYHYKIFTITGAWHSNWLDIPALECGHQVSLDLNFQSEDSNWGANLKGIWNLDGDVTMPVINFDGFVRLTSSVRAVLNVQDTIPLFTGKERVYAGNYVCRGGTVTALLKFFF